VYGGTRDENNGFWFGWLDLLALRLQVLLNTLNTALSLIYTILQFTVAHALGISVFTSRLLATDLNTETITVSLNYTLQILVLHIKSSLHSRNLSTNYTALHCTALHCTLHSARVCLLYMLLALASSNLSQVKVKVILRLTVTQPVRLGVEPHLGLMTRYLLFFGSYGLVFVRRPL
jgi:hypothetical protein